MARRPGWADSGHMTRAGQARPTYAKKAKRIGGQFTWRLVEMLESPAHRVLSLAAQSPARPSGDRARPSRWPRQWPTRGDLRAVRRVRPEPQRDRRRHTRGRGAWVR